MKKIRIDEYLYTRDMVESVDMARRLIMAGYVFNDNLRIYTPGEKIDPCKSKIILKGKNRKYVSRGGLKLEKAISKFNLNLKGKISMDIGSSTGGFTDCMLKEGASKVYSVDVGYGQLDWSLRNDPRVVVMERTNIRKVTRDQLGEELDFISIDVSFISLSLVLPVARDLLSDRGELVALIKPQFEAEAHEVEEGGVIRDRNIHRRIIEEVSSFAKSLGFYSRGLWYSPIKGPSGNIEFLIYLSKLPGENPYSLEELFNSLDNNFTH